MKRGKIKIAIDPEALDESQWGVFEKSWMAFAATLHDWDYHDGNKALAKLYEKHYADSGVRVKFKDNDLWDCLLFPSESQALLFALQWR